MTGNGVTIDTTVSIANSGGVIDGGNGRTLLLAGQDIVNRGGKINGGSVALKAERDVKNESLAVTQTYDFKDTSGSYTSLSNQATITATGTLNIHAGRDLSDVAGKFSADSASLTAGGNIDFGTIRTGSTYQSQISGYTQKDSSITHQLSQVSTAGDLKIAAMGDLNLTGTQVAVGTGGHGTGQLLAGKNINIAAVTNEVNTSLQNDPGSKHYDKQVHQNQTVVGASVAAASGLTVGAGILGKGAINITASSVNAGDRLTLSATDSVNVVSMQEKHVSDTASTRSSGGPLKSKTTQQSDYVASSQAIGSALSGKTVDISAGKDINVLGSAIVGEGDVNLAALGNVNIAASTSTLTEQHHTKVKESGFLSGGGFGISYGTRTTTTDQSRDATTQSGQSRSMVGSIDGNLNVRAGEALKISGSDLSAGTDINLSGKSVTITPGTDDVNGKFATRTTQDGFTLAIGGSVVNAVQTAQSMGTAAGQTSSGRLKALAAAAAGMTAKDTVDDLAKNGPSVKISLTAGHSESESTEVTANRIHSGSVLNAGNNITVRATGGGQASNIDIIGSDLNAKGNVLLAAENQVNLLAAQDTESQHSQSKSWSAAVGVAAEFSANRKTEIGFTASVSASRGTVDGEGTTQINSHVSAGNRLTIASGGDTNLKGAVVSGNQVVADIKGNLNIESLQDTATLDGKRQSVSASGTFGPGAGFSASASQSKVHNDYASVQEQSGIRAGDGGFQIKVAGNTDLKGSIITSTEQAIQDGRNSLTTATFSFSDIQNRDITNASGVSLGVNVGKNQSGDTFSPSLAPGVGKVSGSQDSVTRSGVSGATLTVENQQAGQAVAGLHRDVSTGKDTGQALTKGWNGAQALDEVGAQMQITSAAMPRLAKAIGDYAGDKAEELKKQGNTEEAAKWAEGGIYRVAAHTALGALGGGLHGAVGAAAAAEAAPTLDKLEGAVKHKLAEAGLGSEAANVVAKLVAGGAAGAIGGVAGASAGAVTGLNGEANNRQLHPDEKALIKQLAAGDPEKEVRLTAAACALVMCHAEYPENSKAYKDLKQFADYGASAATAGERAQLSTQVGMFSYTTTGIFSDTRIDAAKKLNNTYQIGTRVVGSGKMALGFLGVAGSLATAPASCLTGVGCFANAAVGVVSLDTAYSGSKQLWSGNSTETYLNQGLQSLGMSPKAAGWVETGLGIGWAATASSMASKAVDQTILLNRVAAGSYRNTIVGDETYFSSGLEPSSQKVLANIAASNKGSASSNFSELGRREALVKEAIAANQSPWPLGYAPVARPLGVGEQFNMVVDANQAKGLRGPGGFATFSNIPNQNYARETLAITEQFKQDVSFVQRFEVVQPFTAKTGPIGPQIDGVTGRLLEGSKTTFQLDLQLPWDQRILHIRPVGAPVPIK